MITEMNLSRAIMTSDAFKAYSMADQYRELGRRLDYDFGPTIALLDLLPTFIDGEKHHKARKTLATQLAQTKSEQVAAAGQFLATFCPEQLQPGRHFDLIVDFARPLYHAISSACTQSQWLEVEGFDIIDDFPLLFSSYTPLKRRFEINSRLALFVERHGDGASHEMALLVLGVKPLTGSLALSLNEVFSRYPDTPLSAIAWPDRLPQSALRYVDRICTITTEICGERFETGERVRCTIQSPEWQDGHEQSLFFGAGAHLCLGRPLSELVWTTTAQHFARHNCIAKVEPLVIRPDSEPFCLPITAPVLVRAGS